VDVAHADVIAVLTRAPSAGGKSRLFAALGRPPDPALLEALLLDTIDGAAESNLPIVAAVTPAAAREEIARLMRTTSAWQHGRCEAVGQPEGDLGERMRGTMARLIAEGARRVVLIGSDLPAITAAPLRAAFGALDRDPEALVLGPALDGGYYLVCATRVPPVFERIPWGTAAVLDATRAAAAAAGLRVHLLEPLTDVDTRADLESLPARCRRTVAWARAHGIAREDASVDPGH
jgi:rSAM/selenodomain-associated transferase 1